MKKLLASVLALGLISVPALAGNYVLTIDGKSQDIDLGQASAITLENGQTLELLLSKKDILNFKTNNFSFDYPSEFTPARTNLGDGIYQTMLATPMGSLILVQEYENMDPSSMIDMMVHELTKEEVQYGYKIDKTEEAKSVNGNTFKGQKAVATYKDEQNIRYVMTYSARDAGLLVVTMLDKTAPEKDIKMVEDFWSSLKASME